MKERFRNKYRTESIRLKNYDYRTPGWYFVTICTDKRRPFFGEIRNRIVGLSHIGIKACQNWQKIPDHFDHVILDEFIVMPNHIHGLIGIKSVAAAESGYSLILQDEQYSKFSKVLPGSLSVIVNQYKGSVTRWCRKNDHNGFKWQPKFHDHIVRNEKSLNRIRKYIYYNPVKWNQDDYYI